MITLTLVSIGHRCYHVVRNSFLDSSTASSYCELLTECALSHGHLIESFSLHVSLSKPIIRGPTGSPTRRPSRRPLPPSRRPTPELTIQPTQNPTLLPSRRLTPEPSSHPISNPTEKPTNEEPPPSPMRTVSCSLNLSNHCDYK